MGKPTLLLSKGVSKLDLNDQSTYYLSQDFVPPATVYAPQFSDGTSANRLQGGSFVSKRATNRSFSFTVAIKGTSSGKINQAVRNIKWFLSQAGNRSQPLYLEYNPDSTVPEPLWGQFGVSLHYEVVFGDCVAADGYMVGVRRSEDINVTITLTLKPFALGQEQRLCSVVGGVLEDTWGSADGLSRGLIVPEATTNKLTNPVFGHVTFGNGWTAGANLTATENTDKEYMLPGTAKSAKLQRTGATSTYTQSINVGNTNKHSLGVFVKLHGGGTLATADVEVKYGANSVQVTPVSVGNGWHWLKYENFDGIASAQAVGVTVVTYNTVYLAVAQLEEKAYCTWPCWGDLLGCAWTGTAHDSTSTRTAASCKISTANDTLSAGAGSIRVVVRFDVRDTFSAIMNILDARDAGNANAPLIRFNEAGNQIEFVIGGVTLASSALTFSAGTIYVIHCTWGPSGASLYINGALADSDTYTYSTLGASLFIGSNYASVLNLLGVICELETFDVALSATQVAAHYANILPLVTNQERVVAIPWLWTKDGDNVVDNCNDASGSTGAPHNNWCVVGGIPGNQPAITKMVVNVGSDFDADKVLWLSRVPTDYFIAPSQQDSARAPALFADLAGTATSVADCGGAVTTSSVNTSTAGPTAPLFEDELVIGKDLLLLARLADAGANLQMTARLIAPNTGVTITADWKSISADGTQRLFVSEYLTVPDDVGISPNSSYIKNFLIGIGLRRSVAGAANVTTDWFALWPRPHAKISKSLIGVGNQSIYISERTALVFDTDNDDFYEQASYTGDVIDLLPNKYNLLQSILGDHGAANVITRTMTYAKVLITPRYELL